MKYLQLWLSVSLLTYAHAQSAPRSVEGEFLVKFRGGPRGAAAQRAQQNFGHEVKRHFDHTGWQHIRIRPGQGVAQYRRLPDVLSIEPNYIFSLRATEPEPVTPNDPRFRDQWSLGNIDAPDAWSLTTGSSNVVVAVLDTGIRYTHEDLAANMWRNPGEVPANGVDDDGNGYVDDVYGIDAASGDSDPNDQPVGGFIYHGTACASIIGAVGNNRTGMTGLNWSVQLMALRLAATSNFIASAWALECFEYVLAMKNRGVNVRVTSNSYGLDDTPSEAVRDALQALGNAGILSVFAAGNSGTNVDVHCDYPACYRLPSTLNVAATQTNDMLASFSNYGATNVDLAAPGVGILVADGISPVSYSPQFSGTSASCPLVAGAAALIASAYPFATIEQIKAALLQSVDTSPHLAAKTASGGRLNVGRAMREPVLSSNAPPFVLVPPQSQIVGVGYPATFAVRATGAENLHYSWHFSGTEFAQTTEPALTIPSVESIHAGDYHVVLSNEFGIATTTVATLTVVTEPTILAQPQGQRVLDGTNVTFGIEAAGAYPLGIQWQRAGEDIAGATNSTLEFVNTDWTMTADYRVVLSNAYGAVTSDVARLTVLTRPYIISQPRSHTVAVGANVSLSAIVTNAASLPITYRWFRNGLPGAAFMLNQHTLVTNFQNIQTNLAGRWSAFVTSEAPSGLSAMSSSNAYLTVVVPPTNQSVQPGVTATFRAVAVGTTPITFQWQRNGTNIPGATSSTLTLPNVQATDAGTYSVVVVNFLGEPTSFSATLRVIVPQPELTQVTRASDGRTTIMLENLLVNQRYTAEYAAELPAWQVLEIVTATNTSMPFHDLSAPDAEQRFYRLRWP